LSWFFKINFLLNNLAGKKRSTGRKVLGELKGIKELVGTLEEGMPGYRGI
jgi:hypothetical protein